MPMPVKRRKVMNVSAAKQLIVKKDEALTAQSAATRARLVATAEKLFAERGIESVSLAEINVAAGQRNKNATHYHFGDKQGLLQAIFDKHSPGVVARRDRLLDELDADNGSSVIGVVRALLYPLAEKLFDGDGGREFTRINAQLTTTLAAMLNTGRAGVFNVGPMDRLNAAKVRFLRHLPAPIAQQRVTLAVGLILHGLADHSRELDAAEPGAATDTELFIRNLEDCLVAVCAAPVSELSLCALEKAQTPAPKASAIKSNLKGNLKTTKSSQK